MNVAALACILCFLAGGIFGACAMILWLNRLNER